MHDDSNENVNAALYGMRARKSKRICITRSIPAAASPKRFQREQAFRKCTHRHHFRRIEICSGGVDLLERCKGQSYSYDDHDDEDADDDQQSTLSASEVMER